MASEKRLIDANEALRIAKEERYMWVYDLTDLEEFLTEVPTVDAVEVVHSWWEKSVEGYKICHHCKADVAIFSGHKNYCPNCGAKMDGGNEDG